MAHKPSQLIWHNGHFVPWWEAKVHVLTHGLHYGSSVFEGIRAYATDKGAAIFRLKDHVERLFESARIHRMNIPFTQDELFDACKHLIRVNRLTNGAYIRPIVFRGYGEYALAPSPQLPIEVAIGNSAPSISS